MGFQHGSIRQSASDIIITDLGTNQDYQETWSYQADLAQRIASGEIPDQLLMLEHSAIYTAGKRTQPEDRPVDGTTPVIDVDRGGRITWHGPGQLVAYPLIKLANPVDVVDYVRRLEQALIQTCRDVGLGTVRRVEGRSGVWLPPGIVHGNLQPARKIAAIGIRVTRGVTMHGISLNCSNTLNPYSNIIACGISDAGVTTLSTELNATINPADVKKRLQQHIIDALNGDLPLESA